MRRIIDLTYSIHEGMPVFPSHWHPKVRVSQLGRIENECRETHEVLIGTHTGTHVDSQSHFINGGKTVDQIPLEVLCGSAQLIDLSGVYTKKGVEASDLEPFLDGTKTDRIILRYDWSKNWGSNKFYNEYPFISIDAAKLIIDKGIKLVGMDTPSMDNPLHCYGSGMDSPVHKILLSEGIVIVEYLCNLSLIDTTIFEFFALPLKINGVDGSPSRCIGIV